MCTPVVPRTEWEKFLRSFTNRHCGWLVSLETHDLQTCETVTSRFVQLESVELDLEDENNPRINVLVRDGQKEIKHILFRPSDLTLHAGADGTEEGLQVISLHTVTTLRFRVAAAPEEVNDVA